MEITIKLKAYQEQETAINPDPVLVDVSFPLTVANSEGNGSLVKIELPQITVLVNGHELIEAIQKTVAM